MEVIDIISRNEALLCGLVWYFTGIPCKNGHVARRYVPNSTCYECSKARAARPDSKAKLRAWERNSRLDPVVREKHNVTSLESYYRNSTARKRSAKAWAQSNPELRKIYVRRNYDKYKAEKALYTQQWRRANRDKQKVQNLRRRALERGVLDTLTEFDIQWTYQIQSGLCAAPHCCVPMGKSYTIDHKIPFFRGGHNTLENIQLLCKSCNSSKSTKTMEEWLIYISKIRAAV